MAKFVILHHNSTLVSCSVWSIFLYHLVLICMQILTIGPTTNFQWSLLDSCSIIKMVKENRVCTLIYDREGAALP